VKSGRVRNTGGTIEFMRKYPGALSYVVGSANTGLEDFLSGKFELFKL
jgi:hypothetical protein